MKYGYEGLHAKYSHRVGRYDMSGLNIGSSYMLIGLDGWPGSIHVSVQGLRLTQPLF
jgi:hypothetical protein